MHTVGSYEAKTHLASLLDRVAKGEQITITRHGVPVAMLVPAPSDAAQRDPHAVVEELLEFRERHTLEGLSIREMIEEGRRF